MSEKRYHFKARYRGVFSSRLTDQTHAAAFHDPVLTALHVFDCAPLKYRNIEQEKTGDYFFIPEVKPKGRWNLGGVDVSVTTAEGKSFAQPLKDVILKHHSNRLTQFQPLRQSAHIRTIDGHIITEGEAYFSITIPDTNSDNAKAIPSEPTKNTATTISPSPIHTKEDVAEIPTRNIPSQDTTKHTSDIQSNRGCQPVPRGCAGGGCFGKIRRLIQWFFILSFFISIMGKLLHWTDRKSEGTTPDIENVKLGEKRLDPKQDTMAPQPWNYYIDHSIEWTDFSSLHYQNKYSTQTLVAQQSLQQHLKWTHADVTDEMLFWHDLYKDLYENDREKLDSLINYFRSEWMNKNISLTEAAEMVVTFVQAIPYVLIHDGSCSEAQLMGGFISDYHQQGLPCKAEVVAGIQSPYEFIHDLQGDCDTRSLLTYAILCGLNIKSSVWVSREYGHSIIGIAVPSTSKNFKALNGTRYFATELTAKGFRVGMIAPEHTDMNNWNIVLYNN
jgi:hypothetical protein